MKGALQNLDWSLIQSFLAVAEEGSLSAAARALGASQPTVGRQIHTIEEQLGTELFHRRRTGMSLTEAGSALIAPATQMRDAAGQISLVAAGTESGISGTVRVTASVFVAHYILPDILAKLRIEEPDIDIEIIASDESENLLFREADIALRMYRPEQLDVVTQHLGNATLGLFAATSYLDRVGRPKTEEDLLKHDWVGYDRREEILRGFRESGWDVERTFFKTRTDQQAVYWELVRAGCGLGFTQIEYAKRTPGVEQVMIPLEIPHLEVWLTAHETMRRTPRIRKVWDILGREMRPLLS